MSVPVSVNNLSLVASNTALVVPPTGYRIQQEPLSKEILGSELLTLLTKEVANSHFLEYLDHNRSFFNSNKHIIPLKFLRLQNKNPELIKKLNTIINCIDSIEKTLKLLPKNHKETLRPLVATFFHHINDQILNQEAIKLFERMPPNKIVKSMETIREYNQTTPHQLSAYHQMYFLAIIATIPDIQVEKSISTLGSIISNLLGPDFLLDSDLSTYVTVVKLDSETTNAARRIKALHQNAASDSKTLEASEAKKNVENHKNKQPVVYTKPFKKNISDRLAVEEWRNFIRIISKIAPASLVDVLTHAAPFMELFKEMYKRVYLLVALELIPQDHRSVAISRIVDFFAIHVQLSSDAERFVKKLETIDTNKRAVLLARINACDPDEFDMEKLCQQL